jgi:hypothetical protein
MVSAVDVLETQMLDRWLSLAGRADALDRTHQRGELEKARPHTIRPFDDPSLRHHVLHVLLPSLEDGRDTSACAETGVTIA